MKASVVIPAYNSAHTISSTLEALSRQTEKDFEVIVVDDGSEDGTREVVEKYKYNVRLLVQEHHGPAAARNRGAREARGDILVFTDSDCVPKENWLEEMLKPFSDHSIAGVQGRYKTRQKSLIPRFAQCEIEERYERMKKSKYIDFIGSYSAAYRRRIFLDAGGFDESFPTASGEDPELSYRLADAGYKLVFNEKAVVYHMHLGSLREYLKKKFYRAYWRVTLYRRHARKAVKDSYTPQLLKVQIGIFYLFLLSLLLSLFTGDLLFPAILGLILILFTLPESLKNFKRDPGVGVISPVIILMRTTVFGAGLVYGLLRI